MSGDQQDRRLLQALLIIAPAVIIALVVMGPAPAEAQADCAALCPSLGSDCHRCCAVCCGNSTSSNSTVAANMSNVCNSFSWDAMGTGCLLDSAGAIDSSAPVVASCGVTLEECECRTPTTADTQTCDTSTATADTTPMLFDSTGAEIAPDSGDSLSASTDFEWNDLPIGTYTYCAPGSLFSSTPASSPYPFPLCDSSIVAGAAYNEAGAYAKISGERRSQLTATITQFDVPCDDVLFTSPMASGPSPLEQCETALTTTLVAKSRVMRIYIRPDTSRLGNIPSGGGVCMDVTIA